MTCSPRRFMRSSSSESFASQPLQPTGPQNSTTAPATHLATTPLTNRPADWLGLKEDSGVILFQQKFNDSTNWICWIADKTHTSLAQQNRPSDLISTISFESLTPQRYFTGSLSQN